MDQAAREAERRFRAGDPAAFPEFLSSLARAGRRSEVVKLLVDTPRGFELSGARELGRLVGSKDCVIGSGSPSPTPEDFQASVVGWELPAGLGGGVLLETFQGRSSREVSVVPPGRQLQLHLETHRMVEIGETEISASLSIQGSIYASDTLAAITVDGEVFPQEWSEFFERVARAASCPLSLSRGVSDLD